MAHSRYSDDVTKTVELHRGMVGVKGLGWKVVREVEVQRDAEKTSQLSRKSLNVSHSGNGSHSWFYFNKGIS